MEASFGVYYEKDSLVDPREKHEKLFNRMVAPLVSIFKKLASIFKKGDKKEQQPEDQDKDEA